MTHPSGQSGAGDGAGKSESSAGESSATISDSDAAAYADQSGDFRRGNINFDFLPETHHRKRAVDEGDRRQGRRRGKRGMFNRGRNSSPVRAWVTVAWAALALGCIAGVVLLTALDGPPARLLVLPIPIFAGMWSLMMLTLLRARPS